MEDYTLPLSYRGGNGHYYSMVHKFRILDLFRGDLTLPITFSKPEIYYRLNNHHYHQVCTNKDLLCAFILHLLNNERPSCIPRIVHLKAPAKDSAEIVDRYVVEFYDVLAELEDRYTAQNAAVAWNVDIEEYATEEKS